MMQEAVRKAITTTNRWTLVGSVEGSVIIRLNLWADCDSSVPSSDVYLRKKNLRGFKKLHAQYVTGHNSFFVFIFLCELLTG